MRKLLCSLLWMPALFAASTPTLIDTLIKNRYSLTLEAGQLAGPGAAVLRQSIANAHFVLIGEDHGISQIPRFVSGVCRIAGPLGFRTLAVETGPLLSEELEQWVPHADRNGQEATFEKRYPVSIPFYNWRQEMDMLGQCAEAAKPEALHLWGLDQEFLGAAGLILNRILETHPGRHATAETQRLIQKDADALSKAMKSGSASDLLLLGSATDDFTQLQSLLRVEGNETARSLVNSLLQSQAIYALNHKGNYYDSNRQRAQLMKSLFSADYMKTATSPKVLFKFGANHMYRGLNPLHSSEIGNYVAELAEGLGLRSVHIMVLGVKGSQLAFSGIGKPAAATPFDMTADKTSFLSPLLTNLAPAGWTLFDLQPLRADFPSFDKQDEEMERLIFGYDYLVLIPEVTASASIQ